MVYNISYEAISYQLIVENRIKILWSDIDSIGFCLEFHSNDNERYCLVKHLTQLNNKECQICIIKTVMSIGLKL